MSENVAAASREGVRHAVERAARATGVDFTLLIETARRESGFNATARAGTSSATGLFQFIESTWLDMVRRHGGEHGLGAYANALQNGSANAQTRADILALRNDPEISARMAGELTRENATALQARIGRAPTAGELYAAHVMGSAGAARLIEAARNGEVNAAAIFPREAAANRGLFFTAAGEPRSAEGLLQRLSLDANASISNPQAPAASGDGLSPALAQALFQLTLLPLLRGGDEDQQRDPLQALAAYARQSRL